MKKLQLKVYGERRTLLVHTAVVTVPDDADSADVEKIICSLLPQVSDNAFVESEDVDEFPMKSFGVIDHIDHDVEITHASATWRASMEDGTWVARPI